MKKILYALLIITLFAGACKNKDLDYEDNCDPAGRAVKIVINWDDPVKEARPMRINLFSLSEGIADYGREDIPKSGTKIIRLTEGCCYLPFCYDYNATNIYFRNEMEHELFEAYCAPASRATYNKYVTRDNDEETVAEPQDFYVHCPEQTFDVEFTSENPDALVFNFYPKNTVRKFTYCIKNIVGIDNIKEVRGDISGMSSSFHFKSRVISNTPSTMYFKNGVTRGTNTDGYIEGEFYTFGPVEPYHNIFTIEILATNGKYYIESWNVSDQITESMNDREAKIERDGYDILIVNDKIPEIPPGPDDEGEGSGFEIGVGEWDEVIINL